MKGFQPDPGSSKAPTNLAARGAYTRLRQQILTGQLVPGAVVNEVGMAAELGVSRTPMREAFRELLSEGLLDGEGPRRQVRVRPISAELLDEVFSARTALEALVAAAAAEFASDSNVDEFRLIAARLADAVSECDVNRFLEIDDEFDVAMSNVARVKVTEDFLRRLRGMTRVALVRTNPSEKLLAQTHRTRVRAVNAMKRSDIAGSVLAATDHLRATAQWLD